MIGPFLKSKHVNSYLVRAAARKAGRKAVLDADVAARQSAAEQLQHTQQVLHAVSHAQQAFMSGAKLRTVCADLFATLLTVLPAHHVLVRENLLGEELLGYLPLQFVKTQWQAPSDSAPKPRPLVEAVAIRVLQTGQPLLLHPAHSASIDPQLPPPASSYYLGLPMTPTLAPTTEGYTPPAYGDREIIGVVVITGPADQYHTSLLDLVEPVLATCAALFLANQTNTRLRATELTLDEERRLFSERIAEHHTALSQDKAELLRTARMREEILTTMNHELRTPLNAVLLYAESLQAKLSGPLNARQLRAVSGIRESANHLLLLVNDLLDVAKLDAGKLRVEIAPVSIASVCESSLRLVAEIAERKQLEVIYTCAPDVTSLEADARRLKQMLVNLLSNAIKFTPNGGSIGLEVTASATSAEIYFSVWDTGIGITPADIARLFQPFVQLETPQLRGQEGTGLGLFLVHRMAEVHGGKVAVESTVGRGSRFTITLPWHPHPIPHDAPSARAETPSITLDPQIDAESATPAEAEQPQSATLVCPQDVNELRLPSVLIVDDDDASRDGLIDVLQAWHCTVVEARTGVEAIQCATASHPDLVLMDIHMPEMNGLDAIRLIRRTSRLRQTCIVAVTALAMPSDREQCIAAGADDYISKPLHIDQLTALFDRYLTRVKPAR